MQRFLRHLPVSRLTGLAICLGLLCLPAIAQGQDSPSATIQQSALQNKAGLHLKYHSWAAISLWKPLVREDYDIDILETWPGGVTFRYTIAQCVFGHISGLQTLTALDDCTALDPWWDGQHTEFDDRCELWVPPRFLRQLLVEHQAFLAVDTDTRGDTVVRWDFVQQTKYSCVLEGKTVLLGAVKAKSNRGDEIVILNDPQNPLILAIDSKFVRWRIDQIEYH